MEGESAASVLGSEDLALEVGRWGAEREVRGIGKAGYAACRSKREGVRRRHCLEKWMMEKHAKGEMMWRTVEEAKKCFAVERGIGKWIDMHRKTPPPGGLREVKRVLERIHSAAERSGDASVLLRRLSFVKPDEAGVEAAERETEKEVERRKEVNSVVLKTEKGRRAGEDYVRLGQATLSAVGFGSTMIRVCSLEELVEGDRRVEEAEKKVVEREAELDNALERVGCKRRGDSVLCSAFVAGRKVGKFGTADEVASKMAHVRWLHEYVGWKYKAAVDGMVETFAEEEGFYPGIFREAANAVQRLPEFSPPKEWPWMRSRQ